MTEVGVGGSQTVDGGTGSHRERQQKDSHSRIFVECRKVSLHLHRPDQEQMTPANPKQPATFALHNCSEYRISGNFDEASNQLTRFILACFGLILFCWLVCLFSFRLIFCLRKRMVTCIYRCVNNKTTLNSMGKIEFNWVIAWLW